jgi:protein phosphatase 2C
MCQDRMHELLADAYRKGAAAEAEQPPAWKEVMETGFARMDDEAAKWAASRSGDDPACRCELKTPARCDHVGSTAVVSVVGPTHIVVASAGDSRAVLSRGGVPVPLSVDHKVSSFDCRRTHHLTAFIAFSLRHVRISCTFFLQPDRPDELERIQAAGGRVIYWDGARVLGVLAMSRAIGDGYLKPFVTAEPEVTATERADDDECLILASDGLWDVITNETACQVVRACFRSNGPPSPGGARPSDVLPSAAGEGDGAAGSDRACSDAALLLTKLALARRSSDNVSVVVVDLRRVPSSS